MVVLLFFVVVCVGIVGVVVGVVGVGVGVGAVIAFFVFCCARPCVVVFLCLLLFAYTGCCVLISGGATWFVLLCGVAVSAVVGLCLVVRVVVVVLIHVFSFVVSFLLLLS